MNPLVDIRDLRVTRGGKTVLQVDQLTIARGEVLAVIGPNGAGKSSLMLTLARLIRPKQGNILFNGVATSAESDLTYRRRIALVLQDPLLFDTSVFNNVAAGLRFRGMKKRAVTATVEHWLERLGISALATRRATELSGGEGQRVSLARALALEPQLLLLDEPFSALDPPTRRRLSSELTDLLHETQTSTVLVTHDLVEAEQMGDRMAVVIGGKIQAAGSVTMLRNSADPVIRDFLAQ